MNRPGTVNTNYHFTNKFDVLRYVEAVHVVSGGTTTAYTRWEKTGQQLTTSTSKTAKIARNKYEMTVCNVNYSYAQPRREIVDLVLSIPIQNVTGTVDQLDLGTINLADPTADYETPYWYPNRPSSVGDVVQYDGRRWTCTQANSNAGFYFYSYLNDTL